MSRRATLFPLPPRKPPSLLARTLRFAERRAALLATGRVAPCEPILRWECEECDPACLRSHGHPPWNYYQATAWPDDDEAQGWAEDLSDEDARLRRLGSVDV